jgi:Asp/Glu/hydantoin racemase
VGFLGILMLQTRFPRPLGDVGHPGSWRMPVRQCVVEGASLQRVVRERSAGLLRPFVEAARALVDEGAVAITTSCGFLSLFQQELAQALPVPVWTSSLLKLAELGECRLAVLTVDASVLGADHLRAAGAPTDTPIVGLAAGCSLQRTLLEDLATLDLEAARSDVLAAVRRLREAHPQTDTLVLECTNLPPYAADIHRATGWPVHDITTLVHERWKALVPP